MKEMKVETEPGKYHQLFAFTGALASWAAVGLVVAATSFDQWTLPVSPTVQSWGIWKVCYYEAGCLTMTMNCQTTDSLSSTLNYPQCGMLQAYQAINMLCVVSSLVAAGAHVLLSLSSGARRINPAGLFFGMLSAVSGFITTALFLQYQSTNIKNFNYGQGLVLHNIGWPLIMLSTAVVFLFVPTAFPKTLNRERKDSNF